MGGLDWDVWKHGSLGVQHAETAIETGFDSVGVGGEKCSTCYPPQVVEWVGMRGSPHPLALPSHDFATHSIRLRKTFSSVHQRLISYRVRAQRTTKPVKPRLHRIHSFHHSTLHRGEVHGMALAGRMIKKSNQRLAFMVRALGPPRNDLTARRRR